MFTRLLLMGILCIAVTAQAATLFSTGSTWRFLRGTSEASQPDITAWRNAGFNDANFANAPAPFWYGDVRTGGTQLNDMQNSYGCIFLRKTFTVNNASEIGGLQLTYFVDDGFVAWINGQQVFSENVSEPNPTIGTLAANQAIDPAATSTMVNGSIAGLLQEGENIITIQVFNTSLGSSDMGFDCMLESIVSETVPPVIVSVSPSANSSLITLSQVTVTFSEPVVGVSSDVLIINTQPATAVSGSGTTYTFFFSEPGYGTVAFSWAPASGITDEAVPPNPFNGTGPNATWQYTFVDTVAPIASDLFPFGGVTLRSLSQIEVTFSEEVTGVNAADLLIKGQPATSVSRPPGGPYIFQFAQPAVGNVIVQWAAAHGITDQAAPGNAFAGGSWSYVLDPNAGVGQLLITEFMASNQSGLLDEDGQEQDWIEIYNYGATAADLTGWSLSDDEDIPSRWIFPARVLPAGEYLVIFASAKDRKNPSGANKMHTNFQLSSGGEFLGLYNSDSPRLLVSSFARYPEQRNDHSYGPDSSGNLRYFDMPSPGAPNGISSIVGVVDSVHFSVTRGHFTQPFDLVLTCPTPGAIIRYTRDGSEPTPFNTEVYFGPIRISNTSLVRATAFRENLLPALTKTHTYFFNLTAAQRSLPILSIVTATSNLIGRSGIIGMEGGSRGGNGAFITNNPATDYHNPSMHGLAWERPVSAEYMLPADNSGFQIDAGLRVQGSDWQRPRTTPTSKFSFRLYFRGDYGPGRLNYPLFPLTTVSSFDQLVLRAGFNDTGPPSEPFIRDETIRRLSHDMGQVAAHGGFMNIFTNGGYAGFYNPTERVHEEFMQSHLGGGSEWDVISPSFAQSAEGPGIVDGDRNDFNNLLNYVWSQQNATTINNATVYQEVARRLDIPNFVDYCMLNAYVAMGDWPANNWRAGRERVPTGIWRFIVWDAEWGMGIYGLNVNRDSFAFSGSGTEDAGLNSTGNSEIARLYQRLRASSEFRLKWADHIQKHFFNGGALTGGNISNRFNVQRAELSGVIPSMQTEILDWARDRHNIIMAQFNTYGMYGFSNSLYGVFASSNAPAFNQHGGAVAPGFSLTMTAPIPGSIIYYTTNGDDPRVMFSGAVSNSAVAYSGPITLNQSIPIRARALWNGNWSALNAADFDVASLGSSLRLTELNYNPINVAHEFLEIQNIGSAPIDLSGMTFEGINYAFGVRTTLAGGARLVLASDFNAAEFAARYPGVTVFGYFGGNLNNGGERIALKDASGNLLFSVDYKDDGGWPTSPDGDGFSLELTHVFGDSDDPANWHASAVVGGSPGNANAPVPAPVVRLNEIMAENGGAVNNGGTFPDFVEIQNTGGSAVNMAGWSLTDDGNARKFVFPAVNIPAGGFLVVWCDATTNTSPGIHAGFALQREGDNVYLFNPSTNRVDAVSFGPQVAGNSIGRIGAAWTLNTPTPAANNSAASLAPASSLSINEWQASAPPGQSDWIELHNSAAQPVALRGCYLSNVSTTHRITSLSFVPAFGFVQLFADEAVGPDHLDFKLPAAGATIVLYNTLAAEVNRVTYSNATEGLTRGRYPDSSATIVNFPGSASPGASNYVNTYTGAVINEVLARNRSAVTNAGNAADYIELFNSSGTAFSLSGMSLSVNFSQPGQWNFPPTASVPANGFLVIWCDGSRPASFAPGDYNTGRSLDGESGGAYLFNVQGQVVNSVDYGFQVIDLPIGLSAGMWRLQNSATPGAVNSVPATLGSDTVLRINEWMAKPSSGADWFELFNPSSVPVDLSGHYLTDDPSQAGQGQFRIAPLSFIGPQGFVKWVADADANEGNNHVNFSLDAMGESLWLFRSANGTTFTLLDSVVFGAQQLGISEGLLPDGQPSIASFAGSATPGESNYLPLPGVVINEVLTHTEPPLEDAVELRNTGSSATAIGGWYLSDSQDNFKKYRIPNGTSIAAGGFAVLYENQFNSGSPDSFTFDSAHGDEVWLSEADAGGNLTGRRTVSKFGAAENGVSFGRVTTSVGVDYAAMSARTFGADNPASLAQFRTGTGVANALPKAGPVVIHEIMYNPAPGSEEYIELRNYSTAPTPLFRQEAPFSTWRVGGGVEFTFPPDITIASSGYLLLVDFDPNANPTALAAFRARYSVPVGVQVLGPYSGQLGNGGDTIVLLKPDAAQPAGAPDAGFVPYIVADKVNYGDRLPWPSGDVDGGGLSLQRMDEDRYSNEPLTWYAAQPSGGVANGTAVVPVPVIIASPQSQNALEGETISLALSASGVGPLGYQWRFNGTALPDATNSILLFPYVVLGDQGDYDCMVSNPGGTAVSARARLSVLAPPLVLMSPQNITNRTGNNVTFSVAARGSAPLNYQWRINGINMPGATSPTLAINGITVANDGDYDVVIANSVAMAIASARLVVLSNTVITLPPLDITVVTGATFTVSVTANGNPLPFDYEWRQLSTILLTNTVHSRTSFMTFTAPTAIVTRQRWIVVVRNEANTSISANAFFYITTLADSDGDGIPDNWENQYGLNPGNSSDRDLDSDGDGFSNWAEYNADTNPTNALSSLTASVDGISGLAAISFPARSNKTYTVQYSDILGAAPWMNLADVVALKSNRVEQIIDATPVTNRFYRIVTPRQ